MIVQEGESIMVGPVQRRKSSPAVVQQLWAGIQLIRSQKQIPNIERLVRYMTRSNQGAAGADAGGGGGELGEGRRGCAGISSFAIALC